MTNMKAMKGTQVLTHIIIIIRADNWQEETDMSQLAHNFRI